jgi:hypothetical protein
MSSNKAYGLNYDNNSSYASMDVYPIILGVRGDIKDKEHLIGCFNSYVKNVFKFVRGYKYWRRIPELRENREYDIDTIEISITARITCTLEPLTGVEEIPEDYVFHE